MHLCFFFWRVLFRWAKISEIVLKSWCFTGGQRMARSKASKHDTFFFKHRQKGLIALAYLVKSVSDSDSTSNSHSSYLVDMFPIKINENPDMFPWYDELLAQWTATKEARRQEAIKSHRDSKLYQLVPTRWTMTWTWSRMHVQSDSNCMNTNVPLRLHHYKESLKTHWPSFSQALLRGALFKQTTI